MLKTSLHILRNPKLLAMLFFGFASGLPFALSTATLSAWYTEDGISLMGIGLLSLIGQPYVYKFIWSPLMDRFIPPFLGRRRGWILITQILLIIGLLLMTTLRPSTSPLLLAGIAFLVAFCSASQDISIGAYMVDIATPTDRGLVIASQNTGYRIAAIISGALALVMAQHMGWHMTYIIMAVLMLIGIITCFWAPEPACDASQNPSTLKAAIIEPFADFLQRFGWQSAILLLIILVLYKLGDAFTLALNTTFLLRHLGFSLTEVGLANKTMSMVAAIAGGIVGGLLMVRLSLLRALIIFGLLQACANLMYLWLAIVGHNFTLMLASIFVEQFFSGLGSVAFTALVMRLCNPRYSATQYALLSAVAVIGRVYVGPASAAMIDHLGWMWFYIWSFIIGLPGVAMVLLIRKQLSSDTFTASSH